MSLNNSEWVGAWGSMSVAGPTGSLCFLVSSLEIADHVALLPCCRWPRMVPGDPYASLSQIWAPLGLKS